MNENDRRQASRYECAARDFQSTTGGRSARPCKEPAEVKALATDGKTFWLCWLHHHTWQGGTSLANVLAGTRDR